jgi:hypothetical protein
VFDKVTITYRGTTYEIGRGRDFYAIWAVGGSRSQPLQWWPETAEGWSAAWARFAEIEVASTIVAVGRRTPPVDHSSAPAGENSAPLGGSTVTQAEGTAQAGGSTIPPGGSTGTALLDERTAPPGQGGTPFSPGAAPFGQAGTPFGAGRARLARLSTGAIAAASLLAVGVILGIVAFFPAYLGGASLAQQPAEVVPHAIYLAVWTASAVLILLGGVRLRLGALLGVGLSAVTFGLFFADAGTAIAGGAHVGGAGLWLALAGWLACATGCVLAFLIRPAGTRGTQYQPGRPARLLSLGRPRGAELGPVVMLVLAGLGVAAAFAPAWDSYLLRTAAGQSQSFTEGNAFANPGLVIAGNVAVMVALAAVVIVAALWRPVRHGAVLLAGAAIPMAAQAISALIQVGGTTSPTQFGLTPAQATQLGLTIHAGLTPAFWIYCGFLVALVVSCAWMLFAPHEAPRSVPGWPAGPDGYGWNPAVPAAAPAAAEEPSGAQMSAGHLTTPDHRETGSGTETQNGTETERGTTQGSGPAPSTPSASTD